MLAISFMSNTLAGIFLLVGIVLFVIAAVAADRVPARFSLVALGLALVFFPTMWDRFAAA